MTHRFTGLLVLVLLIVPQISWGQSVDDLLDRLEQTYGNEQAIEAQITQTTESPFSSRAETIQGTLYMQGDNYRVEMDQQTVVTDGETVWIYTPAENQVIINDYIEDETAFSPSDFFLNYRELYEASAGGTTTIDGQEHHVLDLEPREADSFFQHVRVWLRDSDNVVTRLEVTDIDETVLRFEMEDVTFDAPVDPGTFSFEAPENAEVIDLR